MKRIAWWLLACLIACTDDAAVGVVSDPYDASVWFDAGMSVAGSLDAGLLDASAQDGGQADGSRTLANVSDACVGAGMPPLTLDCTGLYADFPSKTLSQSARPYAPAVPLWSDGAEKQRWIMLPPGQKIDVSKPSEWSFPVGTKLFKQFTYEGKRVETRMFQKLSQNFWVHATYAWNADDSAAPISYGATVTGGSDGGTWVIPTSDNCDSCHRGRSDRILGFEQVSLGLAGATGLTLLKLVVEDLLTPAPSLVNLRVGDDGTGLAAPALSWLHVNCGVSCHNANENSLGYGSKMDLRLDPTLLDGAPSTSAWGPIKTTRGVACVSGSVQGQPRILPGVDSASAVVQLITQRGVLQMPPIASRVVDMADVASLVSWIRAMPKSGDAGAGAADAGVSSDP